MILFILFVLLVLIITFIITNKFYKGVNVGGDNNTKKIKLLYTISGEGNGLDYSQLRELLKEQEEFGFIFEEKPIFKKVHVSFGSYGGFIDKNGKKLNFDPAFYTQKAAIKNVLDKHNSIIKKVLLFQTIKQLIPLGTKFIPKTYTIEEFESLFTGIRDSVSTTSKKLTKNTFYLTFYRYMRLDLYYIQKYLEKKTSFFFLNIF